MEDERKIILLDVNDILPNRFQPRIKFREDSLNELSESIKKYGVIEPIVVRPIGDKYEIIAGERRYKACLLAEKTKVPAIVTSLDDKDSAEVALIENVQREDLTPIEEAVSYKKILEMGYLTQEDLAAKLGKNQGTVANKLRLLNLTEEVQEALLEEKISERHARSLLKLKDSKQQIDMLNKIIENRLTVRRTDEEIEKVLSNTEGKGEMKMNDFNPFANTNESTIPEFNAFAPTQDVPVQEVQPIESLEPTQDINPGFMDVNKIEETAQDINVERPQADIASLLTPTEMPAPEVEEVAPVTPEPVEVAVEPAPAVEEPQSKFMDIPFTAEIEPEQANSIGIAQSDEDAFASSLNALNSVSNEDTQAFNFNFTPVEKEQPIAEEQPTVESAPLQEEPTILPLQQEPEFNFAGVLNDTPSTDNNIAEAQPQDVLEVKPEPAGNTLMEALNILRNCGKQLEDMGFKVNLDEIDLSDTYQITFNIVK